MFTVLAAPGGPPGEANPQAPLVEVEDSDEAQDVRGVPLEASQDGGEAPLEERDAGANDAGPAVGNVAAVQIDADRPPEVRLTSLFQGEFEPILEWFYLCRKQ